MAQRVNKRKKELKGKFEPKMNVLFEGLAQEFKYDLAYEPYHYDIKIEQVYTPDFELSNAMGDRKVFECKGFFRYEDQRRVLAFRKDYPDVPYYLVFERNNPIRKGSKSTYLDWAAKHGIPAAVGEVPKEWFEV
jgi:hypothetical protein